jgi:hypothetical protein
MSLFVGAEMAQWVWVYELDDKVRYPADSGGFSFSHTLQIGFGAHRLSDNIGVIFLGVKPLEHEADL